MTEHCTFWGIAILCRDEELNSQEIQEEGPKNKDSLETKEAKMLLSVSDEGDV